MKLLYKRTQLLLVSLLISTFCLSQAGSFTIGFGVNAGPTEYAGCGNSVLLVQLVFPTNFPNGPVTYT